MRFVVWILLVCSLGFADGCARTVTSIIPYGDQITVTATLQGNIDVTNNRYFLVISGSSSYKVPQPRPNIIETAPEFIEPGGTPIVGTVEAYYNNFFSTWSSYFVVNSAGYSRVLGPFVISGSNTREVLASIPDLNTKVLTFSCDLSKLFTTIPDRIYFDFVTVPWLDGQQNIPVDHLPSSNNSISRVAGSIIEVSDETDLTINPALDIIKVEIKIQ